MIGPVPISQPRTALRLCRLVELAADQLSLGEDWQSAKVN